jgi:hypothetical protein
MKTLKGLAEEHHALIASDSTFQRKARILQSLWREELGYEPAPYRDRVLGSSVAMPLAEKEMVNFLDDDICCVVRKVLGQYEGNDERVIKRDRLFGNLLSSQPMAFNLFARLKCDTNLATKCFRSLSPDRIKRVTTVEFEYSEGRGDETYTGDHSAFDVFIGFETPIGERGFVGIEVKYHENLQDKKVYEHKRYPVVAGRMKCFDMDRLGVFDQGPLHQIWRDHLLVGAHRWHEKNGFADGFFVFLSPKDNDACNRAISEYRTCLSDCGTFEHWTLESLAETISKFTNDPWIAAFQDRYTNFAKVDRLLTT